MKYFQKLFGGLLVLALVFIGCASTSGKGSSPDLGVYGDASEEQLCTLEIAGGLKVIDFDGAKVSWAMNGSVQGETSAWRAMMKGNEYKTVIKIPAGNHKLGINLYLWDYNSYPGVVPGSASLSANGLEISHDFLPGRTYFLRPVFNGVLPGLINKGKEFEAIIYKNTGGITTEDVIVYLTEAKTLSVRLRIDESGASVAEGNTIEFKRR